RWAVATVDGVSCCVGNDSCGSLSVRSSLRGSAVALLALALVPMTAEARTSTITAGPRSAAKLEDKTEVGLVPLVGGNTDLGIGVGVLGSLAHLAPDRDPYAWRLEFVAFTSVKDQDGGLVVPYQDYFLQLTIPDLADRTLRTTLRAAFTRS